MYKVLQTAARHAPNAYTLQRTISGLDSQHISSGKYLHKNFIKKKKSESLRPPIWQKWIKFLNETEIKKGFEHYHVGGQIWCLRKKEEK